MHSERNNDMSMQFVNQRGRKYLMKATIEYTVEIDDLLAEQLEAGGELKDVLEYIALPNISLQSPKDVDISEVVSEHAKENAVLWQLCDVEAIHAQVDNDDYETVVHDEDGNIEDAKPVEGATVGASEW